MPNMQELCKITDALTRGLAEVRTQVAELIKRFDTLSFFSGQMQEGTRPPSNDPPASPTVQAAPPPAPVEPQRRPGPHMFHGLDDVFSGPEKQASERKRKEFRDVYGNEETEAETVRRLVDEVMREREEIGIDYTYSPKNVPLRLEETDTKKPVTAKDMIEEARLEMKKEMDKIRADTKVEIEKSAVALLTNVFGRRIVNMLTPDKLHGGDWLFLAQNANWIDKNVQNGINKSIAQKVESGAMSKIEADSAGGFFTREAAGAQIAGGALIGVFIAQHIPDIIRYLKDTSEFVDAVRAAVTGDIMGTEVTSDLQRATAWAESIPAAFSKMKELDESRAALGLPVTMERSAYALAKFQQAEQDNRRIKEAVDAFIERRRFGAYGSSFLDGFRKAIGIR